MKRALLCLMIAAPALADDARLEFAPAKSAARRPAPDAAELKARLERGDAELTKWLFDYDWLPAIKTFIEQHPESPGLGAALLLHGDGAFDRSDLVTAKAAYERIAADRRFAAQADLARYKLAWVHLNRASGPSAGQENTAALNLFAQVARSPTAPAKLRDEALVDLSFPYAEVRAPANAIAYFEGLAPSKEALVNALSRLANRYSLKQRNKPALELYRHLVSLVPAAEQRADWDERITALSGR